MILKNVNMDDMKHFGKKKLKEVFLRNGFALLPFTDKAIGVTRVMAVTMSDANCPPFGESSDFFGPSKNQYYQEACCSFYNVFTKHIAFCQEHGLASDITIKNGEALMMDISDMVQKQREEEKGVSMDKKFSEWEEQRQNNYKEVNDILEKHGFSLAERNGRLVVKNKEDGKDFLECATMAKGEIGTRLHYAIAGGAFDYDGTVKEKVRNVLDDFINNKEIAKAVDDFYNKFERRYERRIKLAVKKNSNSNETNMER